MAKASQHLLILKPADMGRETPNEIHIKPGRPSEGTSLTGGFFKGFRRHVAVITAAISMGGFWGAIAALATKIAFNLPELHAWIFVGLPTGIIVVAICWKRLPQTLGFED